MHLFLWSWWHISYSPKYFYFRYVQHPWVEITVSSYYENFRNNNLFLGQEFLDGYLYMNLIFVMKIYSVCTATARDAFLRIQQVIIYHLFFLFIYVYSSADVKLPRISKSVTLDIWIVTSCLIVLKILMK